MNAATNRHSRESGNLTGHGQLNAERLLELYDRISEAPDAISRLRRFVLDLAVRGKLVGQDPEDEPASELLDRLIAEKLRMVEAGEIPKPKNVAVTVEDKPFQIPRNWAWARLEDLTEYLQRGKSPKYASGAGHPIISQKCVQWGGLDLSVAKQIDANSLNTYEPHRFLRNGDLLWNSTGTGTIGRVIRLADPPRGLICDSHVTVVRCLLVNSEYIRTWLRSDHVYGVIEERAAGGTKQVELTARLARNLPVPLPPLEEQHRVVAKVDELMALCDRLEETRNSRDTTRDRLTTASLARLTASDTDKQSFQSHARFALNTLPALTARPDQIKSLRQTILDLAVRGKLVKQDPSDEPASALVDEISTTRKRLYAERKIPKPKPPLPLSQMRLPFEVPKSWTWSTLGQLCYQVADGPHYSPKYVSQENGVPFLSTRNIRPGKFDLSSVKYISRSDHEEFCRRIRPEPNDILYTKGGTTGIAKLNDLSFEFSVWVHIAVLRIEKKRLFPRYVEMALNSPHCYAQSQEYTRGISNFDLGLTRMINITVPLPPLAEQRHIVAKVDALMIFCDQLEVNLQERDLKRARLLGSLLTEALVSGEEEHEAA